MVKTKIQQLTNGTLLVTIPKTLAEIKGIVKGDVLDWQIKNGNIILELHKQVKS